MAEAGARFEYISGIWQSVADRGRAWVGIRRPAPVTVEALIDLARKLISGRGETSGVAAAATLLAGFAGLDEADKRAFLTEASEAFGPDLATLQTAARAFLDAPDAHKAAELFARAEPLRQELIRRLNHAPGGSFALVKMREALLAAMKDGADLEPFDRDFRHLFASWFNRGFLVLRRIEWTTPANILEKIIRYEAVHEISTWEELRRRLDPPDRRLYAFFHPALIDEPLIFVEVALTTAIPDAIAPLLAPGRAPISPEAATTAVFYSINNAQAGLAGVSFGNFLIKQVVEDLRRELPRLQAFVTLSPVPGFARWLAAGAGGRSLAFPQPGRAPHRRGARGGRDAGRGRPHALGSGRRLFPARARQQGPGGRSCRAVSSRQRRPARAHQSARRQFVGRAAPIVWADGQLSLRPRHHRGQPRGVRQSRRRRGFRRREETRDAVHAER